MNEEMLNKIKDLLHNRKNNEELLDILDSYHPYDLAEIFSKLESKERQELYEVLGEEKLADIFEYLDPEEAATYLQELSFSQGADVLGEMESDDAADVIEEIDDKEDAADYLEQMDAEERDDVEALIKYDEDTAGSIMSRGFISLPIGTDVKDATKILGYSATEAEVIDPLFVVDNFGHLKGTISLQDLIVARTPLKIDEIMDDNLIFGEVSEDISSIHHKISDYNVYALPILENGILSGIVTMDDAIDELSDDISENMHKMAAISDKAQDASPLKNMLLRIPWLVVLLAISLLISNVTAAFEDVIQKVTVLWFFNTMILDMAGNAGTQVLAVTIRKISREELSSFKTAIKFIGKELLTLMINAIVLGLICFGVTLLFIEILKLSSGINPYMTSFVIALSLSISLVLTGILGAIFPLILEKLHIDPAVASGPLITTVNDVLAMVIYFGLAILFMNQIVL